MGRRPPPHPQAQVGLSRQDSGPHPRLEELASDLKINTTPRSQHCGTTSGTLSNNWRQTSATATGTSVADCQARRRDGWLSASEQVSRTAW